MINVSLVLFALLFWPVATAINSGMRTHGKKRVRERRRDGNDTFWTALLQKHHAYRSYTQTVCD